MDVGLLGNTIIANGIAGAYLPVRSDRLRLRILNGSGGRLYNLGFGDDREFHVVGSDGGLLAAPVRTRRIQLSRGERAEIVVVMAADAPTSLRSFPLENRAGPPPAEAARFGVDDAFDILDLRPGPALQTTATLADIPAIGMSGTDTQRSFNLLSANIAGTRSSGAERINRAGRRIGLSDVDVDVDVAGTRRIVAAARIAPAVVEAESHPYLPQWSFTSCVDRRGSCCCPSHRWGMRWNRDCSTTR